MCWEMVGPYMALSVSWGLIPHPGTDGAILSSHAFLERGERWQLSAAGEELLAVDNDGDTPTESQARTSQCGQGSQALLLESSDDEMT